MNQKSNKISLIFQISKKIEGSVLNLFFVFFGIHMLLAGVEYIFMQCCIVFHAGTNIGYYNGPLVEPFYILVAIFLGVIIVKLLINLYKNRKEKFEKCLRWKVWTFYAAGIMTLLVSNLFFRFIIKDPLGANSAGSSAEMFSFFYLSIFSLFILIRAWQNTTKHLITDILIIVSQAIIAYFLFGLIGLFYVCEMGIDCL